MQEHQQMRYVGANPNNYVSFNNELWRIIGVMNHVIDADGNQETVLKIIRNESIGNLAWDSNEMNNWSKASLNIYLNSTYINGISLDSQNMISNVLWHLGGLNDTATSSEHIYNMERGKVVYGTNALTWNGKIAMMYPSDIRYAVGGNNRTTCLAKALGGWYYSGCTNSIWITAPRWTLTHSFSLSCASYLFRDSYLTTGSVWNSSLYPVYPTLYLKSNVKITGGLGTSSSPFTLSVN